MRMAVIGGSNIIMVPPNEISVWTHVAHPTAYIQLRPRGLTLSITKAYRDRQTDRQTYWAAGKTS